MLTFVRLSGVPLGEDEPAGCVGSGKPVKPDAVGLTDEDDWPPTPRARAANSGVFRGVTHMVARGGSAGPAVWCEGERVVDGTGQDGLGRAADIDNS